MTLLQRLIANFAPRDSRRDSTTAPASPATTEEKDVSLSAFHAMFDRYFSNLDDGVSSGEITRTSEPYTQNPWAYAAIRRRAAAIEGLPFYVTREGGEGEAITTGVVSDILKRPNPYQDGATLMAVTSIWLDIEGQAFWMLQPARASDGQKFHAYPLNARRVKPVQNDAGVLVAWEYQQDKGSTIRLTPDLVVAFLEPNPFSMFSGIAPVTPARTAIDNDYVAGLFNQRVLNQGGSASMVVSTDQQLSDPQVQRFLKMLKTRNEGWRRAGKFMLLHSGLKTEPLGWSPEQLLVSDLRRTNREEIAGAAGCPPPLIGILDRATYSNYDQASKTFWQDFIQPRARLIARILTYQLCERYQPGTAVEVDWSVVKELSDNLTVKLQQAWLYLRLGYPLNAINARLDLGMDDVKWGDAPSPSIYVPGSGAPGSASAGEPQPRPGPDGNQSGVGGRAPYSPRQAKQVIIAEQALRMAHWKATIAPQARIEARLGRAARAWHREVRATVLRRALHPGQKAVVAVGRDEAQQEDRRRAGLLALLLAAFDDVTPSLADRAMPYIEIALVTGAFQIEEELAGKTPELAQRLEQPFSQHAVSRHQTLDRITRRGPLYEAVGEAATRAIGTGASAEVLTAELRDIFANRALFDHGRIARYESMSALNTARFMGMETAGVQEHQWTTAHDEAVRDSHRELDGQVRRVGEEFKPGLRYPGDPAAPLEETVNCRCILVAAETALGDTAP